MFLVAAGLFVTIKQRSWRQEGDRINRVATFLVVVSVFLVWELIPAMISRFFIVSASNKVDYKKSGAPNLTNRVLAPYRLAWRIQRESSSQGSWGEDTERQGKRG